MYARQCRQQQHRTRSLLLSLAAVPAQSALAPSSRLTSTLDERLRLQISKRVTTMDAAVAGPSNVNDNPLDDEQAFIQVKQEDLDSFSAGELLYDRTIRPGNTVLFRLPSGDTRSIVVKANQYVIPSLSFGSALLIFFKRDKLWKVWKVQFECLDRATLRAQL